MVIFDKSLFFSLSHKSNFIFLATQKLTMQITEVKDTKTRKEFLAVAPIIYKNDPVWVQPLDNDIESIFDPKFNNFHSFGEATRWVLKNDQGELIGRVAAFINKKRHTTMSNQPEAWDFLNVLMMKRLLFYCSIPAKNGYLNVE